MSGTYNATIRRVVISAWIGNSIEYYDFLLYGLASALVFGPLFFPGASPLTATLSSFASFGVGFISRPLGALFFGNRGDTLGRKNTLLITLGGMGAVTFLIGCLPSYASIGALAPALLVILRFLQGFMVGGEWGGAMLMVVEYAAGKHRGRLSALSQTGGLTGQLLATGAFIVVTQLPKDALLLWDGVFLFCSVRFWCCLDYICVIVWMRRLSSVRLKSSRPLSICSKKKKGRWSKWYENNGAAFC